jgi:molecular chaperone IbpA
MSYLANSFPNLIGFDNFFEKVNQIQGEIAKTVNYPPYNISKVDDNKYVIELAVAGFAKNNIELELADSTLKITGKVVADENPFYIHKGIATRAFERKFTLADQVEVKDAAMVNGLLKVFLERIIPDHKKPKKIDIKDEAATEGNKQFLTENS